MKTKSLNWTEMSADERDALVHSHFGSNLVGLMKRGLWWREFGKGYTSNESEAWRLTPEKAKEYEYPYDEPTTIHQFPRPAYSTSIAAAFELIPKIPDGIQITAYGTRFKVQNLGMSGAPFIGQGNLPELICLAALMAHGVEVE